MTLVSRQVGYVEVGAVLDVVVDAFVVDDVDKCVLVVDVEEAVVDEVVVAELHAKQAGA